MSKLVKIGVECPNCSHQYIGDFFRTIWGENAGARNMVMEDRINIAVCPKCGHKFHLPLAMMYVDVHKGFAVWWEPNYDPGIDSDIKSYARMFGPGSYYAQAPRIKDWEEFKRVINEFYDGKRVGGPIENMNFKTILGEQKKSNKSGCLSVVISIVIIVCACSLLLV